MVPSPSRSDAVLGPDAAVLRRRARDRPDACDEGAPHRARALVVHAEHGEVVRALPREDGGLGGGVACHVAVPVQVVGRQVQHHGRVETDRGRPLQRVGRHLQHVGAVVAEQVEGERRRAEIAARRRRPPRRAQQVVEERGGGGLAVGAGDAREPRARSRRAHRAVEPFDVAEDGHARRPRRLGRPVRAGQVVRDAGRKQQRVPAEGRRRRPDRRAPSPAASAAARAAALSSQTETSAPQRARRSAAGSPARPRPTTATRSPAKGVKDASSGAMVSGSSAWKGRPEPAPWR